MPYLVAGGATAFRHDTDKIVKVIGKEIRISGSNLVPIIEALKHYEAVQLMGQDEIQRALCSVLSQCNKWWMKKQAKLNRNLNQRGKEPTVVMRSRAVRSLMQEVMNTLGNDDPTLRNAIVSYERKKVGGTRQGATGLSGGYANERSAYLAFNKNKSISASLLDDFLFKSKNRHGGTLSPNAEQHFKDKLRQKKELDDLTLSDWKKIEELARTVSAGQLEVRYMRKFERLKVMLESDGAGGLRYVVGHRSADSRPGGVGVRDGRVWQLVHGE
ncbi:MAG: hypothetical protein QM757_05160 [Paludibaculum sp.]